MTGLKANVLMRKGGFFTGVVTCVDAGRALWAESTSILRITREDALLDAELELERINTMSIVA